MDLQAEKGDALPEWLYHVMEEVDEECVGFLRRNDNEYQTIREHMKNMYKQYPFLGKLFDGNEAINLSAEEHKIISEYLQLQLKMDFREKTLYYWFGHVHCYDYLVRLGALKGMKSKNKE